MPRTAKTEAPVLVDEDEIEGRYVDLDGYTVGFETHKVDVDPAPLFRGLPGDRCQCPHWGVVIKGKVVFRYADYEEGFASGDAYYASPGHVPLLFAGAEIIEFSPSTELQQTMAVVGQNLEAAKAAAPGRMAGEGE